MVKHLNLESSAHALGEQCRIHHKQNVTNDALTSEADVIEIAANEILRFKNNQNKQLRGKTL